MCQTKEFHYFGDVKLADKGEGRKKIINNDDS